MTNDVTTIKVHRDTHQALEAVKAVEGYGTYNELLKEEVIHE